MIRRVLVPIVDAASTRSGLETALLVGLGFGAHVDSLYVKRPPWQFFQFAADGVDPKDFARRKREIEYEEDRNLALARQSFEDITDQLKIERRQNSLPAETPSVWWTEAIGMMIFQRVVLRRDVTCHLIKWSCCTKTDATRSESRLTRRDRQRATKSAHG